MPGHLGPGLERVALDLHVHTPASHDWRGGTIAASDFVQRAIQTGLDGVAVTDHESGAWVDDVKAAAAGTTLTVFPAVELNNLAGNRGIHLVIIFDTETTSADIDRFLTTVGVLEGTGATVRRGTASKGILEVLDEVSRWKGIAVLAHCQSSKGALGEMAGDIRTRVIQHPAVLAAEATAEEHYDEDKAERHKRTYDLLDGSDPTYKRELAVYQASDNPAQGGHGHTLEGIGSRYCYFFVERPLTLESLRQSFIDRGSRIAYPGIGERPNSVPLAPFPHLKRLAVTGGFLDGLDLEVHPGLTTVLGSKGSGKSIVVELLRFALDQEPTQLEVRRDHDTKLEKRLMLYGRVKVTVSDDQGNEYVIEREYDPANDNPFHGAVTDPADLFPCHFLSQGEIVRIAESETEQIRFIDSFFDFRAFQRTIDELRNELTAIDQNVAEQIRARTKHGELDREAKQLRTQIGQKDKELASPVFAKFQEAQAKDQAAKRTLETLDQLIRTLSEAIYESETVPDPPPLASPLDADPLLKRMHGAVQQGRNDSRAAVEASLNDLTRLRTSLQEEYAAWQPTLTQITDEYSREIQKSGGDRPALSQERARLVTNLASTENELSKAKQVSDLLRPTVDRRNRLLEALKQKQADYTTARQQRCDWFEEKSEGQIRAQVSAGVNYSAFRAMLEEMKRGSYLAADQIDKIASNVTPEVFVRSILRYDLSQDPSHLEALAKAATLPLAKIQALADFLIRDAGYERLLALEYSVTPEDRPSIFFRVQDGSYTPLDELSTGQKCTALLVMALGEGNMPIVVDQPEDSLDIRSIWDDMCVRLRDSKRGRQFLFTTHNSSLAVASDSDKFIVLAADAKKGEAVMSGAIDGDEVRQHVILLLEGGPPTYFLKHRKYNVTDPQAQ